MPKRVRSIIRDCSSASLRRARPAAGLFALAAFVLLFAAFAAPSARAQSRASIDAREQNGFARIIIDFDSLPVYKHEFEAGILVLSFETPVEASLDDLPKDLPDYVGLARRDPDGRAFRLALNRPYLVNLMDAGDQLYVDILPPGWKGQPPPLPSHVIQALSSAASQRERKAREEARQRDAARQPYKLDIRMTRNPTFNRIVFDWNRFTTASLTRDGRQVKVRFGAWSEASLAQLKSDAPNFLHDVKLDKTPQGMEMTLTVDDDVDVRGFREGLTYVVDLTGADASANASVDKTAEMVGAASPPDGNPVPGDATDRMSLPAAPSAAVTAESEAAPATIRMSELQPEDMLPENLATRETLSKAPPAARHAKPGPDGAQSSASKSPRQASLAAMPKPSLAALPLADKPAAAQEPEAASENGAVMASVDDNGGNLRITFPFNQPLSAAAFRRGRTVWLVFDGNTPLDVEAIKEAVGGKLVGVQHVRKPSMQYLRLQLSRGWLTYVKAEDSKWIVDIGDMVGGEAYPLRLQRKLREDKRSVIGIKLAKPGHVHWLDDPEIGDRLAVVTAFPPQRSVMKPQDFVEFEALATAHGVAIHPRSDDIAVRLELDEVVVTQRRGLTLSAGNVYQYAAGRKPLARTARAGYLDIKAWGVDDPAKFSDRVHELQRAVALAGVGEKNARRFALARLYFSNNFAMETSGVLKRMASTDPGVASDPSFNALRGATLTLLGRNAEARKDFEVHALAHDPDAALWLGLLDVADKNWETALENFDQGADLVNSYYPDLQARFRLAATRAALWLRRLSRAADELDALPASIEAPALQTDARLLRGWYLESIGRIDEALEDYDAVLAGDERPAVAEAELRTISLLLREGRIKRAEAIKGLERLLIIWRGDNIELGGIRKLASLYIEEKDYRDAFTLAKNGVMAFPESRLSLLMQDEMKQVFRDLYLKPKVANLKPIEALGLYYDFRELTPVGRQGDEIIRRLADRLIGFDLLDQASVLLEHQVNHRLKGAARSQVAMRLAMVQLMNHKPDLALRTIRQTRQAGLPNGMHRSRSLLEARALGELGRAGAALEILGSMSGEDVEKLKADALWNAQDWQKAAQQMEQMLGARWQDAAPLSDTERFNVLRAAVAYSLAGDQFAIDRMHKKFYEKMIKTRDAEPFVMVTRPVKSQGVSFRDLARDIAATDTLDAFMKDFRARYDQDSEQTTTGPAAADAG